MRKRFLSLTVFALIVVISLIISGCTKDRPLVGSSQARRDPADNIKQESREDTDVFDGFLIKSTDTVKHVSFADFLESCALENVKAVLEKFPADAFEDVSFYTVYYMFDGDNNVPISVIVFTENGKLYFFSGADTLNDVFISYQQEDERVFSGKSTGARVWPLVINTGTYRSCHMQYPAGYEQFALVTDANVDFSEYFRVLSKVTRDEYRVTGDGVTSIGENTVSIFFTSYEMTVPDYRLSVPGILKEIDSSFRPPEDVFVNYSSDDNAPGGDMVNYPARLSIEFEIIGNGQTALEIFGDDGSAIYCVNIMADADAGASIEDF